MRERKIEKIVLNEQKSAGKEKDFFMNRDCLDDAACANGTDHISLSSYLHGSVTIIQIRSLLVVY